MTKHATPPPLVPGAMLSLCAGFVRIPVFCVCNPATVEREKNREIWNNGKVRAEVQKWKANVRTRADIHSALLHFRPHFPMIPYFPILSRSSRGSRARQSARGAGGLARGRPAVPRAHEAYPPPSPARLSTFCQGHPRGWRYRHLKREDSGAQAM